MGIGVRRGEKDNDDDGIEEVGDQLRRSVRSAGDNTHERNKKEVINMSTCPSSKSTSNETLCKRGAHALYA